jgi:S-formylglutathione hydrolase FrmB
VRRAALLVLLLAAVAGCGGDEQPPRGVEAHTLTLRSAAVGETLRPRVLVPRAAGERPPLLVLLHGQASSPESMESAELLAELDRLGERAPVVLLPDGGEASYWHDRRDGAWARMVLEEAIPAAARRFGADAGRVAVAGVSMGGFGALHLADRHPGRFCSVSAHSPAIFPRRPRRGSPFAEAFDGPADFARTDLIARAARIPAGTWVDVGDADPFAPAVRALVRRMREPRYREWRGGHDFTFWQRRTPEWLRFHLERC